MSSTYSTNLALELIGTGDQAGTWGNTTNTNLGTLLEQAISGYVTQAVATGTDTTITIPNGSSGVARNMYIELTGTGGASTNLIVPANKKLYFIFNNSTGAVTVKVSGQTGVSVPTGKKMVLVSNGTDIVNGINYIADFASNSATITHLSATSATITNLTLTSLVISNLSIASANITTLTSASATITNLLATSLAVSSIATFAAGSAAAPSITTTGDTNTGIFFPAADTIAFTEGGVEAGRFDSSGNFNIGTTTVPGSNGGGIAIFKSDYPRLTFRNTTTGDSATDGTQFAAVGANFEFYNKENGNIEFGTNNTERLRLDSSGNLGIGTSSPAVKLQVKSSAEAFRIEGTTARGSGNIFASFHDPTGRKGYWGYGASDDNLYISNEMNAAMLFLTNSVERARITSAGVLMVGTTGLPAGNGTAMSLAGSSAAARIYGTTEGTGALYVDKSTNTSTTAQVFVQFTINAQATGSGQINANGASQAAFGSFSDRRLKDNIVDLASQWGSIKTLRPVEFDYIASEGGGHQLGFIAQEVKEVYPDLVGERADKMLTLSGMGKNEARLIKALQEAMARIEQLEAKFAALESK